MRLDRLFLSALMLFGAGCGGEITSAGDAGDDGGSGEDGGDARDAGRDAGPPSGTVTIFQIQDPDRVGWRAPGSLVRVAGARVAAIDAYEERGEGEGHVSDVWIADPAGGPFSGVHVYMPMHVPCAGETTLRLGDVVTVDATIQEFAVPSDGSGRTVTQLVGGVVTCTTPGDGVGPAPQTIADLSVLIADATAEPWEGVLVELANVDALSDPDSFGAFALRDGPPVDDDLYRHPGSMRDRFTRLGGIFHYMFGRWALFPRRSTDIELGAPRIIEWEGGLWGCADGEDGDGDSAIDCDDADCAASRFCRGPRHTVQDLQDVSRATHPAPETDVSLAGPLVVTAIDTYEEMPGSAYVGTVVVQDPLATDPRYSGIHVFVPIVEPCAGGALAVGDRVYVAGRYREYAAAEDTGGTLTEIATGVVSCRVPGEPITPTLIDDLAELQTDTAEPWEGVLVELRDVGVSSAPGEFGRFRVARAGAYTVFVNVDDDYYAAPVVFGDRLTRLAGVFTYAFELQLEPRSADDVEIAPSERGDAECGNGLDEDGDGLIDCLDLDCCATVPCAGEVGSRRLILSEVLYDAPSPGTDDRREWVEIRNAGASPVPLACYTIGNGANNYLYSRTQLPPIMLPPGGCALVGGPDSCSGPECTIPVDFDPDLLNTSAANGSAGVALLYGLAAELLATASPVDAVIYGNTNAALLDATGTVRAPDIGYVTAGRSIERDATGAWVQRTSPTPGTCTAFTP